MAWQEDNRRVSNGGLFSMTVTAALTPSSVPAVEGLLAALTINQLILAGL